MDRFTPPFCFREECHNEAFNAIYVSYPSFPFLFVILVPYLTPPFGYLCQLVGRFHALSLSLQDKVAAMRVRKQEHQTEVQRLQALLSATDLSTITHVESERIKMER